MNRMAMLRWGWMALVVLGLVLTGCGAGADGSEPSPALEMPEVEPMPTSTPAPTSTPEVAAEPASLGSSYENAYSEAAAPGTTLLLSHYPPDSVQYDEMIVDDELVAATLVCDGERQDVTSWFTRVSEASVTPAIYTSWSFESVRMGCQIDFEVKNVEGETVGLAFKAHCPRCY